MSDLPPGWAEVPLGKVAVTQLGRMLSARRETGNHARPYLRNRDVQWGKINTDDLPVMDFGQKDAAKFLLQQGDILVCEGGEVGRAAIWNGQLAECYYQKALHRVRPTTDLVPQFLVYLLEQYARTRAFERYTSGSTIAHLPQEDLRNLLIPLPAVAEQKRIVAAIEEQFSRLEVGTGALRAACRRSARMRSAVLEAAIKGLLAGNVDTWRFVSLSDIADVGGGITKNPKRSPQGNAFPFLRVANILRDKLDLAEIHQIELFPGDLERYRLRRGDLLIVEGNGSPDQIGRSALWDGSIDPCVHQNHLIRARPREDVMPDYLNIFWNAPSVKAKVQAAASSTSGLHTLSTGKVRKIEVALPPLSQQRLIVEEVQRQLSAIDNVDDALDAVEARARALQRSILAAAFSGRLT